MYYLLAIFLVFLDLLTKFLSSIYLQEKVKIIGDYFFLKFAYNEGIAFSLPLTGIFLKIVTILIIAGLIVYYYKEEKPKNNKLIDLSYILILSGAIGNGYERVFNSKVIDFIGVKYFSIFNFADIYISLGVILFIILLLKPNIKNGK